MRGRLGKSATYSDSNNLHQLPLYVGDNKISIGYKWLGASPIFHHFANFTGFNFFSSFNEIIVLSFSGLSPVQLKSPDAIGVGKSTTLHCWYYLDSPGELIYSVSWYWTPPSDLDFQRWDKSRLMSGREFPNKTVQFFRYRNIDPDGERRKAWDHQLQGIFHINVGFF